MEGLVLRKIKNYSLLYEKTFRDRGSELSVNQ